MEDENASRYKDRPKNPRRRHQMAPEHESAFSLQEPIRHSKSAELPSCGLWPNGLWVTIRHTLFNLFARGCIRIQTLIVRTYFLESPELYK